VDAAPSFKHFVLAFVVGFLLWLLLVGTLQPQELAAGALVALVASLAAWPRLGVLAGLRLSPAGLVHLLRYLGVFLVALLKANLHMARLVLSPSLPIRPAVVAVRTGLQSPLGRMLLANSITLTPGTLSIEVQEDRILVHWVDCPPGTDLEAATRAIAESFERHIRGFLK
jgi:multicomponent Na+:H+ antiporter subunit E